MSSNSSNTTSGSGSASASSTTATPASAGAGTVAAGRERASRARTRTRDASVFQWPPLPDLQLPPLTPLPLVPAEPAPLEDLDENELSLEAVLSVPPSLNGFYNSAEGLVTIRIRPDDSGRFGFNVKGGYDSNQPIIVSKVAVNMPADLCIPRLHEGDQVLFINGRDVSTHTHEQVVQFIRAAAERHSGELVLVVRPAIYVADDDSEGGQSSGDANSSSKTESEQQKSTEFTSEYTSNSNSISDPDDPLQKSMLTLRESMKNGSALASFEQLYRRKPGLTMLAARQPDNVPKNRYRDISPYDQTRVPITESDGDYINASFVNMEIPRSGVVNRYIAAQGPLPNTSSDFWLMCWEQQAFLVVMLTANSERGRTKCHQYWPDLYETTEMGGVTLTCLREQITPSFAFRELMLSRGGEERRVSHMQYISWPDHGVPPEHSEFVQFVQRVRSARAGQVEPVVVHCSAGIGRTGVLITMETAMGLIEANQPVKPLEMVRVMRDQRAMLIQTPAQFRFVCDAILRVYEDGLCRPLDEFKR